MATSAKAFIAGVGSPFVILAIGFGGGLMMAKLASPVAARAVLRAGRCYPVP